MAWGIIDGLTTNPSKFAKEDRPFDEIVKKMVELVDGPIHLEAVSQNANNIVDEAKKLCEISEKIVVKIPVTQVGLEAANLLHKEHVQTNLTLIFSPCQALLAAKAGASYVSPFIGRLDDVSYDGIPLIHDIMRIYGNYRFNTEVVAAAIRNPVHILEAAKIGAHAVTANFEILDKLFNHPLTGSGLHKFLVDWEQVSKRG